MRVRILSTSEVMCHVRMWINSQPTKVVDRENNKLQLWRDFIPALEIEFGGRAPRKSRKLQRQLFSVMRGGLHQLNGVLGEISSSSMMIPTCRYSIWRDILMTVRATGGQSQGNLATFKLPDPKECSMQTGTRLDRFSEPRHRSSPRGHW